ncbi:MAG: hypothetical protein H6918_07250 [Sphingomonadaceae bacterium]|nr:hypothetical protein [Sphingomonadaceae bacterium]
MEQAVTFLGLVIQNVISLVVGGGVLFACLYWAYSTKLHMWRVFEKPYGRDHDKAGLPSKLSGAAVITKRGHRWGGFRDYRNYQHYPPVHVIVAPDGLVLEIMWPFTFGSKKLFLPNSEMQLASVKWALWGNPIAIRMAQFPELDIIVYREVMEWAGQYSPQVGAMMLKATPESSTPVIS